MSQRYRLTPEAQANVDKIGAFIATENVEAALRVLDAFDEAFTLLAARPELGHKREDLTDRPVKFWRVYSYLIVYDPASAPLSITAVLHGSQDVQRLLKDGDD